MSDPATDVRNQFFGVGGPDQLRMYDGFAPAQGGGFGSYFVRDLRGVLFTFVHDLLRGLKPVDRAHDNDVNAVWGFRDSVNVQHLLAVQNNYMLRKLCEANKIDLSKMPGN
jgi:hypothetical protein